MKIVLVGPYSPTIGGVVSHIINLHQRLLIDKWDVKILDVISTNSIKQENIIYIKRNPILLIINTFKLIFKGYKLFHFNISQKGTYITLMLPILILFRIKYLITFHSGNVINSINSEGFIKKTSTYLNCYFASKVLFVNNESANQYEQIFSFNNSDFYASYIKKNIDELIKNRVYLNDNKLNIVCTGLWQEYYRYEDCIKLFIELENENLNPNLIFIVGSFAENQEYKNRIKNLIPENNVEIIQDCKDPLTILSRTDILIRTSSIDSYGLSVAEALSVGSYALATNVCKRPVGSILFNVGDIKFLKKEVEKIYNNLKKGVVPEINDSLEDGYLKISNIYKSQL